MNVLKLILELDATPLEREIRDGGKEGYVITYYNEKCLKLGLLINTDDLYDDLVQICIVGGNEDYFVYVQHGESPDFIKIPVLDINTIDVE